MMLRHGFAPVSFGLRTRSFGKGGNRVGTSFVEAPLAGIMSRGFVIVEAFYYFPTESISQWDPYFQVDYFLRHQDPLSFLWLAQHLPK